MHCSCVNQPVCLACSPWLHLPCQLWHPALSSCLCQASLHHAVSAFSHRATHSACAPVPQAPASWLHVPNLFTHSVLFSHHGAHFVCTRSVPQAPARRLHLAGPLHTLRVLLCGGTLVPPPHPCSAWCCWAGAAHRVLLHPKEGCQDRAAAGGGGGSRRTVVS